MLMGLEHRLKRQIAHEGPITVAAYMAACLHDPEGGYYAARPRLGADGDFITAPLISQMFGELIGLWAAEMWDRLGRPATVRLVELGPGDGTLMRDALRVLNRIPGFAEAADLWLVEPSAPLQALQAAQLSGADVHWAKRLDEVPGDAPLLLIANEVLDCLPARQFVRTEMGWAERRVGLDAAGELAFGLSPPPGGFEPPAFAADAPMGAILELSSAQTALAEEIGLRVVEDGGAALLIDYGRDAPGFGDTLQALRAHTKVSPLATPGLADLTVHADFPTVASAAIQTGAATTKILSQAAFLRALGIEHRTGALIVAARAKGRADQAAVIERQYARLMDPDQMGTLFKVMAIHQKGLVVAGFEDWS
jgi:SAM-dependent MidA family methyltransferase